MNKTVTIILNETPFDMEDSAYEKLKEYLSEVEKYFSKEEAKEEIIKDIENNFASKLEEKLIKRKQKIVLEKDVDDLIAIIGRVEDFEEDSNKKNKQYSYKKDDGYMYKKLYRNPDDVILAGVCSGLAVYLGIESNIIRIIFAIFTIFTGFFPGFIIYFVLWAILPVATTGSQKLEMSGEIINLKNIKEKIYQMKDDIKKATMNENNKNYVKQKVKDFKKELDEELDKEMNSESNKKYCEKNINKNKEKIKIADDIFSIIIKIFLITIGILFIVSAISGFIGVTVALSFVLFSPDIISNIINIDGLPYNFIQLLSILSILATLIPLIFFLIIGISLLKRKNVFKIGSSVFLLVVWVFVISSIVFFSARYISYDSIKINNHNNKIFYSNNEVNYLLENFNKIKIQGPYSVIVSKGNDYVVKAKGEDYILEKIKIIVENNELIVTPKDIFNTMVNNVYLEIILPEINSINLNGATKLELLGFYNNENLDINLNGASFLKTDLYSKDLNINLNGLSRLEYFKNQNNLNNVENLRIFLNGASSSDLLNLAINNSDVNISGASNLKINTVQNLKVFADGASSIEYYGNPKINKNIKGLSSLEKIENSQNTIDINTSSF